MQTKLSLRALTRAIGYSVAAWVVILSYSASCPAGEMIDADDFAEVGAKVEQYTHKIKPEKVLLVLDIDNTLLAMDSPLGSDQWFEWQRYLIAHEPSSKYAVSPTFNGLIEAQGLLYDVSHMHPPQPNLPGLMRRTQELGIRTLVLTSRGPEFRAATEREFERNGYDFAKTALPVRDAAHGTFVPYDAEHLDGSGLTKDEVHKFQLSKAKPVNYENGILMTSGQNKGAMLLVLLNQAKEQPEAIVHDDDNIRHVANVYTAVHDRGHEITAFHYTKEDANVKAFDYGSKKGVDKRWRKLTKTLEEVLQ
ncbi:MAG TPA: DUF2608 domain-containing protein [Lacipirellulaceae bacterium]|jgi:hypothetical protein|nr:DUF2608 domain-containing protein [Lacipirellulaceae bacterium]